VLHPQFDAKKKPGSSPRGGRLPGCRRGPGCLPRQRCRGVGEAGKRVILVRHETSPEDIRGMAAAQGILTSFGGKTSHAAVVGRQMGKPCVVGCSDVDISYEKKQSWPRIQPS